MNKKRPKLPSYYTIIRLPTTGDNDDHVDRLPHNLSVSYWDLLCYIFAIVTYAADVCSDVTIAYYHWSHNRIWPFVFISTLIVVPSIVLNIVAFAWWTDDSRWQAGLRTKCQFNRSFIVHAIICIFQFGPIGWYIQAFVYACRFRRSPTRTQQIALYRRMLEAECDASLLRLFEAFLESAPQTLVQGYLLGYEIWQSPDQLTFGITYIENHYTLITVSVQSVSIGLSLLSLSWSVTIQHRCLRLCRDDKANMAWIGTIFQFIWRLFTIMSRSIAFVLFAIAYRYWLSVVFALHYLLSLILITKLQPIDMDGSVSTELVLVLIASAVHLFMPFNLIEGNTRLRYTIAYTIEAIENAIMLVLCVYCDQFDFVYKIYVSAGAMACFAIGIVSMLVYYLMCHPTRRSIMAEHHVDTDAVITV